MLALLSLSGAAWLSHRELDRAAASRQHASHVAAQADVLVDLADVRARLLDEHNWSVTSMGIADLGISNDSIVAITGIDPETELGRARAAVDQLTAKVGSSADVGDKIDNVRGSDTDLVGRSAAYLALEAELREETEAAKRELESLAAGASEGGRLVGRVQQLVAAIDARQAVAAQLTTYFSAQFAPPDDLAANLMLLVRQQLDYEAAMATLESQVGPDAAAAPALAVAAESPDVRAFRAANVRLIETLVSNVSETTVLTNEQVFGNITEIKDLFVTGGSSAEIHLDVVVASQQDLERTIEALSQRVASQTTTTLWTVVALAVASLLVTALLARYIGVPLRRLAEAARRLRDGDTTLASRSGGPLEVRIAAAALREAAENLALTQRQTIALANAQLDDPVLDETVPGGVGVALQAAVRHLATSLNEREQFRQRLAHEATHDGLTQLPNRSASLAHLRQGLARTMRSDSTLALLFLDLDGFKAINDRHGHQAGDKVLRVVAQRLVSTVREGDHVGRFGGDELLVIAEPVADPADAVTLAERLIARLEEPIDIGETMVEISACVGIGLVQDDRLTIDELLRDADLAVYQAKARGRGAIEVCDAELKADLHQRATLHQAIESALVGDEFVLHYQPVIDSSSGELCGVEALVRWLRPEHGMVPPVEFIPFAERSDLIIDIDRWVLEAGMNQLVAWTDGDVLGAVPVAVNVSSRSISSAVFADFVLERLGFHGLDPARLVLEITESALLDDLPGAATHLDRLRAAGVQIAIDDFGTGYTSLASLKQLPFDILKVDRSYTADKQYDSLVKLIIDTGHLLGATITAEGVEDAAQARRLAAMGSDTLQGYLYGKPCAPGVLEELVVTRRALSP